MKILIRLPNWLGDVVMSTAFIEAVRQLYSFADIDVIIKKDLEGIAQLIPGLRRIHTFSKAEYKGAMGAYRFGKKLRSEKYDLFFCLPDSLSSALMGRATDAHKRIGFRKEGRQFLLTNSYKKPANLHRVDEYISLLQQFSQQAIGQKQVRLIAKAEPVVDEKLVIINFNSEASSRRMPGDKAKHLLTLLQQTFSDVKFGLIGSPKEKAFIDELTSNLPAANFENFAGKTSLSQLAGLMASAKAVLTTDSGPAHLANSVGTPVIVLFGAGNEENTAPYNKENLTVIRAGQLTCEPCVRNTCQLYGVPKCMQLLDDTRIINALSLYLRHA